MSIYSSISSGNRSTQIWFGCPLVTIKPKMTPSSGLQSVCNSSVGYFFVRVTCYPHHGRYEAESIRAALASPIDRDPSLRISLDLFSLSLFDALKVAMQHSWWTPFPFVFTFSREMYPEHPWATGKNYKHTKALVSKLHLSILCIPMPCLFVHPILSCRFVHTADEYAHVCVCVYIYIYVLCVCETSEQM